jgi:DNA repair exonuclease SbcCD nuclease subunit
MKIAIINDTHAGVRNSSDIFLDNAEDFYGNCFFPYLLRSGISHIVHLGDFYDVRKFINFKVLNRTRSMFLDKLRENKITMDIIPGNHDTYFKNTNDLNSLKELLGHYMNEVHIVMEPTVMEYGSLKMALVPWINKENYESSVNFIKNCKADILGGHLELQGFDVLKGVPSHSGMDHRIFERFEQVYSGHFHTKSKKDNITYLGSQMEFTWSDAHDQKYFHVLDTESRELTAIPNDKTIFHRIKYDDTTEDYSNFDFSIVDNKFVKIVVLNKSNLFTFDEFVDRIQSRPIHELKIAEDFKEFSGENVEDGEIDVEETSTLLDSYVESVETDLDKNRLKISMRNLLTEAQAMEIA